MGHRDTETKTFFKRGKKGSEICGPDEEEVLVRWSPKWGCRNSHPERLRRT